MASELDQVSLEIGKLMGAVDGLRQQVSSLDMDISQDRAVQAQHMAAQDIRFAKIDETMRKVEPVCNEVAAMKPHVDEFKTMRAKLAFIAILVGGAVSLLWQGLVFAWPWIKSTLGGLGKS